MIKDGHPPKDAWNYTPREIHGWLQFITKHETQQAARDLSISALGSRGEPEKVKRQIKEWSRE